MPSEINPLLSFKVNNLRSEYLNLIESDYQPKLWSNVEETESECIITIVIPTKGCSWALSESGGCSVCGYVNDSSRSHPIPSNRILDRIEQLLNRNYQKKPIILKIFNSGSFFDEEDVPQNLRLSIVKLLKENERIRKLAVESRPQYILNNVNAIEQLKNQIDPIFLEIGIGLESSNNAVLRDCLNKGVFVEDYEKSVQKLQSSGIRIKSYIFIKPPFLTELEAINDAIKTAQDAFKIGTDIISLNPCNIQNGTLIHHLYRKDSYQPPWLWSILFIVKSIRSLYPNLDIICEPSAAGKRRGVHNCGKCDEIVLNLIQKVIKNETISEKYSEICSCFTRWKFLVESPIEVLRLRKLSKLRNLTPLNE